MNLKAFLAAWAAASSGPIFFIVQAGYPPLSLIVLILLAVPALPALAVGWLGSKGRIGRTLAAFVVGIIAVALHNQWLNDFVVVGFYLLAAALSLWVYFRGDEILGRLAIFFAVIGALSVLNARSFFDPPETVEPSSDLPPIIHIILDEHGPGGFDGFSHWPRAYSRHFHTVNALPDILEGYPEKLESAGYQVETWQSEFLEICKKQCATYDQSSLSNLDDLSLREQGRLLASVYGRRRLLIDQLIAGPESPSSINARIVFENFIERTDRMKRGEAIIFHAMLPHYPWSLTAECETKDLDEWGYRLQAPFELREARYNDQRQCTEKLTRAALRDDAIVVLHGDHGNRILMRQPTHDVDLSREDLHTAFTTLFAMRIPGLPDRQFDQRVSVSSLIREWDLQSYPVGMREDIFLDDADWKPRRRLEMPD